MLIHFHQLKNHQSEYLPMISLGDFKQMFHIFGSTLFLLMKCSQNVI
jgi:hypothetical protein